MERLPEEYQMWMGRHKTLEEFKAIYEVDEVRWHDELPAFLGSRAEPTVYVVNGPNADSGNTFTGPEFPDSDKCKIDTSTRFFNALIEARVFKTEAEIEVATLHSEMVLAALLTFSVALPADAPRQHRVE